MPEIKCREGCDHAVVLTQEGAFCLRHYAQHNGNLVIAKVLDRDQWDGHLRQIEARNHAQRMVKAAMGKAT